MKSMTVTEFELQVRKSDTTTKPPVTPKPEKSVEEWWENYRSGSFC